MNGSIRRRGKGSWELTIDLAKDANGKRQRKFINVKGRKADAERRLRELLAAHDRGIPLNAGKLTVGDYLYRWHKDYVEANTRFRTSERYMGDIRNHLIPHLGHLLLTKVTPAEIQQMEASLLSKGLSPRSVQHAHRVLSEALKHAVRWGLTWHNPCNSVQPPRQFRKEIRIPDVTTVLELLERAKETPHYPAFHVLAHTGMRRGEVCGLTWQDVDLDRETIVVNRAAVRVKGQGIHMFPPKTEAGRRSITIDSDTVDVLRSHRGSQLVNKLELGDIYQDQGYVLATPLGEPLDPFTLTDAWRRLCEKAGVSGMRLHDLRHFHATMLLKQGIHPKVVQERLGHSVISVTLDVYSHVVPGLQEQAANAFAQAMKDGAQ